MHNYAYYTNLYRDFAKAVIVIYQPVPAKELIDGPGMRLDYFNRDLSDKLEQLNNVLSDKAEIIVNEAGNNLSIDREKLKRELYGISESFVSEFMKQCHYD